VADAAPDAGAPPGPLAPAAARVPPEQIDALVKRLRDAVMQSDLWPHEGPVFHVEKRDVREVRMIEKPVVVLPLRVTFTGTANQLCAVALVTPGRPPTFVPDGGSPCAKIDEVAVVDLNDDGIPDFAFLMHSLSNRYPAEVEDTNVYLSVPSKATYCASAGASAALSPQDTVRSESVVKRIRDEVRRLGPTVLDCGP
jgi:hypothetical protein